MSKEDIFEQVKTTILEGIEKKGLDWFKPWTSSTYKVGDEWRPINRVSGRAYSGTNIWILSAAMVQCGYEHNEWGTYKNIQDWASNVRKGEKAFDTYHWNIGWWNPTTKKTFKSMADAIAKGESVSDIKQFFSLKIWKVFNIGQCENIEPRNPHAPIEEPTEDEFSPIDIAEAAIKNWAHCPKIKHGGNRAYYSPMADYVQMPEPTDFIDGDSYYKTLFHELVHSTGHKARLNRKPVAESAFKFGDADYSVEELVAESGSMMAVGILGLNPKDSNTNSQAYINNWLKGVRETPAKAIVSALTHSSKAIEYMFESKVN
jgi:antirestriction protein ArdC